MATAPPVLVMSVAVSTLLVVPGVFLRGSGVETFQPWGSPEVDDKAVESM